MSVSFEDAQNCVYYIYLINETCAGDGVFNYSIRGRCTPRFFTKTVQQFFKNYDIDCKGLTADQMADSEWCVVFSTKQSLYRELFDGQHIYVITQVPTNEFLPVSRNFGTMTLNLETGLQSQNKYVGCTISFK